MPPGIYLQDGGEMSSALGNILGNIAPRYMQQPTPENFNNYLRTKAQNAKAAGQAFADAGIKIGGREDGGAGGGAGARLRPATSQEVVFARNALSKPGATRQDIIDHGKQKGFDLEASGF